METVTIIGAAGAIGSSIFVELHRQRLFKTFNLVDPRKNVLESYRIDLAEASIAASEESSNINVYEPKEAVGAGTASDLVICAATKGEKPGLSRSSFAAMNWELLRSLMPLIEAAVKPQGTVLLVSNPIDVLAARLARESAVLGANRILGYSLNDSTRLRAVMAMELGVDPKRVSAQALGMHGEVLVPLFSDAKVNGKPVDLSASQRERIVEWMDGWFDRWQELESGRSSTWSTAVGVALMVTAMRGRQVMPTSIETSGVDFLPNGSFIALPAVLEPGRAYPDPLFGQDLDAEEREKLITAAEQVKAMSDGLS